MSYDSEHTKNSLEWLFLQDQEPLHGQPKDTLPRQRRPLDNDHIHYYDDDYNDDYDYYHNNDDDDNNDDSRSQ